MYVLFAVSFGKNDGFYSTKDENISWFRKRSLKTSTSTLKALCLGGSHSCISHSFPRVSIVPGLPSGRADFF